MPRTLPHPRGARAIVERLRCSMIRGAAIVRRPRLAAPAAKEKKPSKRKEGTRSDRLFRGGPYPGSSACFIRAAETMRKPNREVSGALQSRIGVERPGHVLHDRSS